MGRLTWLHLGDQLLVKEALGLLVQWAVDGDNITLAQHLLEIIHASASNLLLELWLKRLVVKVQQFLAVKSLESSQHTLADASHSNGTNDLSLEIILVLGGCSHIPFTSLDLLVCGYEIADESEDGHDNVLGDGDDVGACHFGDGDTAVCSVGGVQVDVVGADTGSDGDLELFRFGESLSSQVARMEAIKGQLVYRVPWKMTGLCIFRLSRSNCLLFGWTHGVVMITSASTSSLSNVEFSPSLSDVVTKVWPWSSSHFRIPSSFSVVPSNSGTSLACSWPYLPQPSTRPFNSSNWDQLNWEGRITNIVQDKQDFRLSFSQHQCYSRGHSFRGGIQPAIAKSQSAFVPHRKLPVGPGERSSRTRAKKQDARGGRWSEQIPL